MRISDWSSDVCSSDLIDAIRATGNAHLIERTDDLIDIERQMLAALTGTALGDAVVPAGAIVVAEDLLPSQLVTLAAAKPAGLCPPRGGPTTPEERRVGKECVRPC